MLPCLFKEVFGVSCPGCGLQRAFAALLQGNLVESLVQNPALIPMLITGLLLTIHLKMNLRYGPKLLVILSLLTAALMIVNFVARFAG
jgi:hypothetical protein